MTGVQRGIAGLVRGERVAINHFSSLSLYRVQMITYMSLLHSPSTVTCTRFSLNLLMGRIIKRPLKALKSKRNTVQDDQYW